VSKRDKTLYEESYKVPGLPIRKEFLPQCPHATGCKVTEAFIRKAGRAMHDGQEVEYQDLRVYFVYEGAKQ
jgi:hypothetical protein